MTHLFGKRFPLMRHAAHHSYRVTAGVYFQGMMLMWLGCCLKSNALLLCVRCSTDKFSLHEFNESVMLRRFHFELAGHIFGLFWNCNFYPELQSCPEFHFVCYPKKKNLTNVYLALCLQLPTKTNTTFLFFIFFYTSLKGKKSTRQWPTVSKCGVGCHAPFRHHKGLKVLTFA